MNLRHVSPGYRLAGIGVLATLAFAGVEGDRAHARGTPAHAAHEGVHDSNKGAAHEAHKGGRHGVQKHALHGSDYHPPFAAIVVDDNTGQTLYEVNADEPRHPASLTKIMTLYMLFEQLEAGRLKLDTQLPVSAHAAGQAPVKLGLKPNQTIAVEDALRAMVTKSANDAAAVVAEAIGGGDEAEGARLMTAKARALGMSGTTYVNGSGLPAEEQITTARDQALLGLLIHNRFPNYYAYFSLPSFNYHGREMHNHNGLLGNVHGVDGIKTGYTEASGYNLVASVQRDAKHIVAVVLGGTSNGQRDGVMRQLIEAHIVHASAQRTAPPIMEVANPNGARANPIVPMAATAVAMPAPAAAAAPAPALAPAPSGVSHEGVETDNPVVPAYPPASATLASIPTKPHLQHGKLRAHVATPPPIQASNPVVNPVVTASHVSRPAGPRPPSARPATAAVGAPQHHAPAKPSVP
jgi:D-alanyl-D-alanine carboxypeptidase